jgi:Histidine kinase-, DNA gyrase B-, and HSP90-like ATPase
MATSIEAVPNPVRLIEGLRDTGYKFHTAIADLVDNSIAANATVVNIRILMDYHGAVTVWIVDNGCGMTKEGLISGMTYGSPVRPDPASLGKFGLGLKTASTAFCRRLSVISRASSDAPYLKAIWDLDHVADVQKWELLLSTPADHEIERLKPIAKDGSGTLVVWDKVDRLLKTYQDAAGGHARNALDRQIKQLHQHLSMVYQRFLDPRDKRTSRKLNLDLQGTAVEPWDPFAVKESDVVASDKVTVELNGKKSGTFTVRAFVLPRKEEFSDPEAAEAARISTQLQGIYVYRENRLIYGPDWLGMVSKEPHSNLLRVEFSFDHELDEAFHIDIKKSEIILNQDLYVWLDDFLQPARRAADDRYRQGQRKKAKEASAGAHDASNASIHSKEAALSTSNIQIVNEKKNEVMVENKEGQVRLRLKLSKPTKPGEFHVQPVAEIDDGMLWQPALIDLHKAVQINTGHPYYYKVDVPNLKSGVIVQGMDSLLWALSTAELGTVNDATKDHFLEMRFEVSKLLRRLVEDLPEPELGDEVN